MGQEEVWVRPWNPQWDCESTCCSVSWTWQDRGCHWERPGVPSLVYGEKVSSSDTLRSWGNGKRHIKVPDRVSQAKCDRISSPLLRPVHVIPRLPLVRRTIPYLRTKATADITLWTRSAYFLTNQHLLVHDIFHLVPRVQKPSNHPWRGRMLWPASKTARKHRGLHSCVWMCVQRFHSMWRKAHIHKTQTRTTRPRYNSFFSRDVAESCTSCVLYLTSCCTLEHWDLSNNDASGWVEKSAHDSSISFATSF